MKKNYAVASIEYRTTPAAWLSVSRRAGLSAEEARRIASAALADERHPSFGLRVDVYRGGILLERHDLLPARQ